MRIKKQLVSSFLIVLTMTFSFVNIPKIYAATTGVVTNNLKVRSNAGTTFSELGLLTSGTIITITNTVSTSDGSTGCPSNLWHAISYNGTVGYVCTSYVSDNYVEEYYRPWTTAKKSIVGGAKYIAKYYIAVGQDTSYLKKFNVTPKNTTYAVYTHQYMTNVRAPWSEAKTSYNAYSTNGLLEKPLVFNIPVFLNMPDDYTSLPGEEADTTGQSEITDPAFETLLDAQQFPESYRKKLRLLHTSYPNWIFEALHTNLDWEVSVDAEQPNSYIDGSNGLYRQLDGNGNYILREGNSWYLANSQTTAYFLDPRNFLKPERILMFEKLSYSEVHTEAIIQTLLNSTFMAGTSPSDNQSYASIFIEAGQVTNVSSIYLASLAIQEVGVGGSMATSGAQFSYNGITYVGLYNFFNIGAKSSEVSPVRAGLVWANGGSTITVVGDNGQPIIDEHTIFSKIGLTKNDFVSGIAIGQTLSSLKSRTSEVTLTVTNSSNVVLTGEDKIGTGSQITISSGTNNYNGTVVVYGDINGDSDVNAIDLLYLRKYLLKTVSLSGANLEASKLAKNDSVGAADLLYLRKHLLDSDTYRITQ